MSSFCPFACWPRDILRVALDPLFLLLLGEIVPPDAFLRRHEPRPLLAGPRSLREQGTDILGNCGHAGRAGSLVARNIEAGIPELLREPCVIFGIGLEDHARDGGRVERPHPPAFTEHGVGDQEMRMQVGVARCGAFALQLGDFAVPDIDHDPARRVMGEFQPRHMARLGAVLAVASDAGLPDIPSDRRHGLASGLYVSMENLRLLDRVGEGPCDRH